MKKFLTIFSIVILSLFFLSIFGWMVSEISVKKKKFGFLTGPVKFMYSFPNLFSQSVEEVKSLPKTFIPTPGSFQAVNKLKEDVYVISTYSDTGKTRSIVLLNLKNNEVLKKWTIQNPHAVQSRILNPLLLPDGSLVYGYDFKWTGLERIDSSGKTIWQQRDIIFHHAMELNNDGDIWACTKEKVYCSTGMYKLIGKNVFYIDYTISKIDSETGEILFHKSISQILKDNNLENYILKSSMPKDPIHLNDVQPALKTTKYYQEDDVFISLRNQSCIIHYRPSDNKVIQIIEGPFISQHDIDFLNDHTLAIFNNNYYVRNTTDTKKPPKDSTYLVDLGAFYSNIVTYNYQTDKFDFIGDSVFRENKIFTRTEGLMEFIEPSTYFVEEQNSGFLWIIKDDEVLYKNVLQSHHKGYHHLPNWTRIIKNYD